MDSNRELRLRALDRCRVPIKSCDRPDSPEDTRKLLEELRIHQIELEMQNEELLRAQEEIETSRSRYFDLYNLAPVGYITVNSRGVMVEWNLLASGLFDANSSYFKDRIFAHLVVRGQEESYLKARNELQKSGHPQTCEVQLRRVSGTQFWGRLEMCLAEREQPCASRIVIIDVTDRKEAELRFDAFMRHNPNGASIADESGRYVAMNPAMKKRAAGSGQSSWMGKGFSSVWPTGVAQRVRSMHKRALASNELVTETESQQLGSQERIFQTICFPFEGPDGKKLVGSISADVTEQTKLAEDLQEANKYLAFEKVKAEEATEAKTRFLSAMSHEIRTPLNGVIGMSELLLQTELTAEQASYAHMVADSAEVLLSLVNNVLDFSKIEAGKVELAESSFDLECLIEDVLNLVSFKAREKSLELACWYPVEAPRQFSGDAGRIRQLLLNFLSNAVKFTASGYILVQLEAGPELKGICEVRLSVSDTGIGISQNTITHLFTPFGQADATIAKRFGGTGLGLTIAKQMAELMGGQVGVESEEGEGSTFCCILPLKVDPSIKKAPVGDHSLAKIPVMLTGAPNIAGNVILRLCQQWGMQVRQCEVPDLPGALVTAFREGSPPRIVIADMQADRRLRRRRKTDVAAEAETRASSIPEILIRVSTQIDAPLPALIMVTSDSFEKTRGLVADAVMSTPVRATALWQKLSELVHGTTVLRKDVGKVTAKAPEAIRFSVLVADDNVINQKLACALLSRMGCQVDIAADGAIALQKVSQNHYGLVLMDCVMPNMDGFAATQAIRRLHGAISEVPIIALTASATVEDREHCFSAGMNDFITKPVRSERLAEALAKWIRRS